MGVFSPVVLSVMPPGLVVMTWGRTRWLLFKMLEASTLGTMGGLADLMLWLKWSCGGMRHGPHPLEIHLCLDFWGAAIQSLQTQSCRTSLAQVWPSIWLLRVILLVLWNRRVPAREAAFLHHSKSTTVVSSRASDFV